MKLLRNIVSPLPAVGLLLLQLSCGGGGEPSGPGHTATALAANSSTTIPAPPGTAVLELPSVVVRDENGAPLAGAPVTFAVTSGGGSVTGASATTNASGIATVGSWTIGSASTVNTLTATTGSLAAVVFTGCATEAHALDSPVSGQLALTDCPLSDGSFTDFYTITIPATGTYVFDQASPAFDTYLALFSTSDVVIGVNDDFGDVGATDSRVTAIVPAGTYIISANSFSANMVGSYSLASTARSAPVTNCEDVFVLPGITSAQSLESTDCNTTPATPTTGFFYDDYVVFLNAGQSITVGVSSSTLDSYVELRPAGSATVLASNDDIDASTKNARITFTVPNFAQNSGFYIITAASPVAGTLGDYSITVQ
ncbi:MAG TPA: Ig-like domain-containing protein [Gemmatimonadaceae bacterium]|nr:Ig-like domain-containing protein [Gemmatimonadaceae bacterium]